MTKLIYADGTSATLAPGEITEFGVSSEATSLKKVAKKNGAQVRVCAFLSSVGKILSQVLNNDRCRDLF